MIMDGIIEMLELYVDNLDYQLQVRYQSLQSHSAIIIVDIHNYRKYSYNICIIWTRCSAANIAKQYCLYWK